MNDLKEHSSILDHLIQSEVPTKILLNRKIVTCVKSDKKFSEKAKNRLEENFPEHIIGCKLMKNKKIATVTSRNILTIRKSASLTIEEKIQCDYFATSICSLIIGDTPESLRVFFGSVIGDLIDWKPNNEEKPMMRKGHKGMIFSIVADSTRIFTISDDRTIRMWLIADRESGPISTAFGHTARPFAISIDPLRRLIYTGGIEQTLFCWEYDGSSVRLVRKTPLSVGVIRKITQLDRATIGVSTQNGNLLKLQVTEERPQIDVLLENVISFAHLKEKLVVLTGRNELVVYESDLARRILFRCSNLKHMTATDDTAVIWHHNTLFIIKETVHRLKLSMSIISATCHSTYVAVKTIDGFIQIYTFSEFENIRCLKRFRSKNASMIPTVFTVVKSVLIMGSTHGELFHADLTGKSDEIRLSLSRSLSFELFGGKEVTCIRPITSTPTVMVLGKTGMWSTLKLKSCDEDLEILNSRSFSSASRVAWPSQFIEWNKGKDLLIVGFYGTSLIIWNSTTGLPMYEFYCGGGHRVWQLTPCPLSADGVFNFDFTSNTKLFRRQIDLSSKKYMKCTAHSSPIVAGSGSENYLVTASLDGHLSIGSNKGEKILTIFIGENLLCTDILECSEDSTCYVITGGGKSKFSLLRFLSNELQSNVFWARHITKLNEGRIVAVKVCKKTTDNIFFVASYSSGVIEVFKFSQESLESVSTIEVDDMIGIGSKIDYHNEKVIVGTSGSYILIYSLKENGCLEEENRMMLSDRSGVTAIAVSHDGAVYIGCDSGHVYKYEFRMLTEVHAHLSTVVGIVLEKCRVHSVSLDCTIFTSTLGASSSPVSKMGTNIDMPSGMVKTQESTLVIIGDGTQIIDIS